MIATEPRLAWCLHCDGPEQADERGCLGCRSRTCTQCGEVRRVLVTMEAVKKQPEQRLCVPCWSRA